MTDLGEGALREDLARDVERDNARMPCSGLPQTREMAGRALERWARRVQRAEASLKRMRDIANRALAGQREAWGERDQAKDDYLRALEAGQEDRDQGAEWKAERDAARREAADLREALNDCAITMRNYYAQAIQRSVVDEKLAKYAHLTRERSEPAEGAGPGRMAEPKPATSHAEQAGSLRPAEAEPSPAASPSADAPSLLFGMIANGQDEDAPADPVRQDPSGSSAHAKGDDRGIPRTEFDALAADVDAIRALVLALADGTVVAAQFGPVLQRRIRDLAARVREAK